MSRHILIIESVPNARLTMSIALRNASYKVSSVFNEEGALSLLVSSNGERPSFDLVIVDTETLGAFGRRLAHALRQIVPTVPLLMVSNFSDKAFIIDLVSHGHREFIENFCGKNEATTPNFGNVSGKDSGKRA